MESANKLQIPSSVQIGGQRFEVRQVDKLDEAAGQCLYFESRLDIADTVNGQVHSDYGKFNVYNHELVHAILFAMGEDKLSMNERFVNCFAGFLTEARVTEQFNSTQQVS